MDNGSLERFANISKISFTCQSVKVRAAMATQVYHHQQCNEKDNCQQSILLLGPDVLCIGVQIWTRLLPSGHMT